MAPSRIIILGVALATAVGAGYVAMNMATPPTPPPQEPAEPRIRLTEVLVLRADVAMGSVVGDQIGWQSWPTAGVTETFVTRDKEPEALDELREAVARVPLYSGEPLRRSKLIGDGRSFMSSILPSGKRAVATEIAADTSAGGFILPNDNVDVIMTRRASGTTGGTEGYITETILKNIRVLAIDQTIQEDEEGRRVRVGDTATLELTPQQAEIITVAQQLADRLTLALRAVADAQEVIDEEADYLVSGRGRGGTVRLIRSGEMIEVGARR